MRVWLTSIVIKLLTCTVCEKPMHAFYLSNFAELVVTFDGRYVIEFVCRGRPALVMRRQRNVFDGAARKARCAASKRIEAAIFGFRTPPPLNRIRYRQRFSRKSQHQE